MLLALNKAFLYLNCQPRIFRKVPQASLSVCTKNYAPVYKHGWMQKHKRAGPSSTPPCEPHTPRPPHPSAPRGCGSLDTAGVGSTRNSRATGRGKGSWRKPPPPQGFGREEVLSHPTGQVGEDSEECGAQTSGPGSGRAVFSEKLENEISWQGVWNPVPEGASEVTGRGQCSGSGVPCRQSWTVARQGPGILSP